MAVSTTLVYIVIALASVLAYFYKRHLDFWKRRGIPHIPPDIISGSMKGFLKTRHFREILQEYYNRFKGSGPFAGFFFFLNPAVFILDLELAKNILIKDFNNFTDRGLYCNEKDDPLSGHLFALRGEKWRSIRNKMSPTFTSGKMKFMFPTVVSVGERLLDKFNELSTKDSIIEMKDVLARFTVDVIGQCAFGIECNSLKDPKAEFRVMGGRAFSDSRHSKFVDGLIFSFPETARRLGMRQIHEDVHQFFMGVVRQTVDYREKNSIKRNDFMNLLIESKNSENGLTIDELAAQAFVFFLAGFETSSTTMGFVLFELALNQDIQEKLRAEINEQFQKHDEKFTYECMAEMHYMEKVLKETLRKYSVVTNLFRKAVNDYTTSDPKYTIPKGVMVMIPIDAFHRDPELHPDPEKFDPERFSPEEIQKRHPATWMPFGDGPRNCIGLRFGKMQVYIGLSLLLRNYKFSYCNKTPNPLEMQNSNGLLEVKGGVYLRVERIR